MVNPFITKKVADFKFKTDFISEEDFNKLKYLDWTGLDDVIYNKTEYIENNVKGYKLVSNDSLCGLYGKFWHSVSGMQIPRQIVSGEANIWYSLEYSLYIVLDLLNETYLVMDKEDVTKIGDLTMTPLEVLKEYISKLISM